MKYRKLKDLCSFSQGKQIDIDNQYAEKQNGFVRFLRIVDYTNDSEPIRYVENYGEKFVVAEDDVIMIRYGSKTAGKVVRGKAGLIANNMFRINPCNDEIDKGFLYYYLSSQYFYNILNKGQSSSTMPAISFGMLENLEIIVPSINQQKRIVSFLNIINKKIDNNSVINDNLEEQTQAMFQYLFIDNSSSNWLIGTISDLGVVVGGSTPSKAKPEYYTQNGIAWITPKDLSNDKSKFISHGENDITELGLKNSSASIMPAGTVLFSSRAPIGYIAIAAGVVTTNQGFKSIIPHDHIGTAFVYCFLKHNLSTIENMASGSTFKEVSGSVMKSVPAKIPSAESLEQFTDFCAPIFEQQKQLEHENLILAEMRDALLPKLMSGEIDVSDINI